MLADRQESTTPEVAIGAERAEDVVGRLNQHPPQGHVPAFVIRNWGCRSPESRLRGTSPRKAPISRVLGKRCGSSMVSTKVSAVIGPTPTICRSASVAGIALAHRADLLVGPADRPGQLLDLVEQLQQRRARLFRDVPGGPAVEGPRRAVRQCRTPGLERGPRAEQRVPAAEDLEVRLGFGPPVPDGREQLRVEAPEPCQPGGERTDGTDTVERRTT